MGVDGPVKGVRASGNASRGKTAEARFDGSPTDVPTPGCRSQSVGRSSSGRERPKPSGPDNEAPEATGVEQRPLMRSRFLRFLTAPSGKTYGRARDLRGSTDLSTKTAQPRCRVSTSSAPMWTSRGQGHRRASESAQISTARWAGPTGPVERIVRPEVGSAAHREHLDPRQVRRGRLGPQL